LLFFFSGIMHLQAQKVMQGAETALSNNKIAYFTFKRTTSAHSGIFISDYIISYKGVMSYLESGKLLEVQVKYDSAAHAINVLLLRLQNKDTIKELYHFIYADSLGLIFNTKRTFTELPTGKFELLLGFDSAERKYLQLYQLMDKNMGYRKHYRFDVITMDMLSRNIMFLNKR
jgi:hypothetical protein